MIPNCGTSFIDREPEGEEVAEARVLGFGLDDDVADGLRGIEAIVARSPCGYQRVQKWTQWTWSTSKM